jgi:hypothetical protein
MQLLRLCYTPVPYGPTQSFETISAQNHRDGHILKHERRPSQFFRRGVKSESGNIETKLILAYLSPVIITSTEFFFIVSASNDSDWSIKDSKR